LVLEAQSPLDCRPDVDKLLQGKMESHSFVGKHEPAFIHEEGQLSYDPTVYSSSYEDRFHIKTLDVSHLPLLFQCFATVLGRGQAICFGPSALS